MKWKVFDLVHLFCSCTVHLSACLFLQWLALSVTVKERSPLSWHRWSKPRYLWPDAMKFTRIEPFVCLWTYLQWAFDCVSHQDWSAVTMTGRFSREKRILLSIFAVSCNSERSGVLSIEWRASNRLEEETTDIVSDYNEKAANASCSFYCLCAADEHGG